MPRSGAMNGAPTTDKTHIRRGGRHPQGVPLPDLTTHERIGKL